MKVAVYEHARDGGPQPPEVTIGLLCERWGKTPRELRQDDPGELLRIAKAMDIYHATKKPQKQWSPQEVKLMMPIIAMEVKKRAGQL